MNRMGKLLRICVVLLIVNLLIIWGNSLMPGDISKTISEGVKEILKALMERLFPGKIWESKDSSFLVRKLGHFLEFTALGACLAWLLCMLGRRMIWAFPLGVTVAAVDETIQLFVSGREGKVADVDIDSCGVLFGMLLLYLGYSYCRKRKNKEKKP